LIGHAIATKHGIERQRTSALITLIGLIYTDESRGTLAAGNGLQECQDEAGDLHLA